MIIVANTYFLRHLRNLDFFTLDLGKTRRLVGSTNELRKLDAFIIKYKDLYKHDLMKYGYIGSKIIFYEDIKIDNDKYIIFKDDDIYEINFLQEDILDLKNYILETLRKIDNFESEEEEADEENRKNVTINLGDNEGWESDDNKNGKKKYLIDQTLSREEYRRQIENIKNK